MMIKFFRKIRQDLLSGGKTGKPALSAGRYLKYAIGEIVLVVLGILIALQINNWNEQKKQDRSIVSHLEILKQNLKEDQVQLRSLEENMTENLNYADAAMNQIKTLEPVNNSIKKYLILLNREFQFSPNTNAIETITQSNEIPALNTELRTAVLNYYALISKTQGREHISNTHIQTKYEAYINNEYPECFEKDNEFEFISSFYKDDPRPATALNETKLLQDKTLETLLVARYYQCSALQEFYKDLIASSSKILSILDKEE